MNLPNIPLLVLDTETTGFVPKVHHVMEFACVKFFGGNVTDEIEELISLPGGNDIPLAIQMITRITPSDLEGKKTFADLLPMISPLVDGNTIIVGQNVQFDLGMLRGEGWDLTDYPWIDTSMLASLVFPELHSYSLGYMSDALKLDHTPRHRALGDVRATAQLLEKCTERLLSLPEKDLTNIRAIAEKGPRGYREFFAAIAASKAMKRPSWLQKTSAKDAASVSLITMTPPDIDTVQLVEEPLSPTFVQGLLSGATGNTWIAVKNLEASVRRFDIPDGVAIIYPPEFMLDDEKLAVLRGLSTYTADEMTLLMKADLYKPTLRTDIPLHGGEYQVWSGKMGCTDHTPAYESLLQRALTKTALISHQYLLTLLNREDIVFPPDLHLIIDDASMLEDTATNAYSWTCHIPTLRAASQGNNDLMQCTDVIELWSEKIRNDLDLRYLDSQDLASRDSTELRSSIATILTGTLPDGVRSALDHLLLMLDPENLHGRISWIEAYQDGSKTVKSVPENIALLLKDTLFSRIQTTLLIPPFSATTLTAVLAENVDRQLLHVPSPTPSIAVKLPLDQNIESVLTTPVGKTILLVASKRTIEDIYVKYTKPLEEKGIALFCQGFSGGQGRMQAEFEQAESPAYMVMTPWMYEGVELPPDSVDRFVMQVMPFDHPKHAVISKRALRYRDPFSSYSLPRLKHRLFRLLRTFSKHAKSGAEALVLDERLRTKGYGKEVAQYLLSLGKSGTTDLQSGSTDPRVGSADPKDSSRNNSRSSKKAKTEASSQLPLL